MDKLPVVGTQPSSDPETLGMTPDELEAEIRRLRTERNAVILAHFYQESEIQDLADFVGDSLQLSQAAPGSLALLWISGSSTPFAALGGTVHAFPTVAELLLATDGSGALGGAVLFPGAPAGTGIWFQFICQDASSVFGLTLSNAVKGTVP